MEDSHDQSMHHDSVFKDNFEMKEAQSVEFGLNILRIKADDKGH